MSSRFIPLFWRLFVPNAVVLGAACLVLYLEPANGRLVALVGGLVTMLAINLVLMRHAFAPLGRLHAAMERIDPLSPGRRIEVAGPESEVTLLGAGFNEMLDRLEAERRESARRAQSAQEDERRRVAAELHDEVGQGLTVLLLELRRLAEEAPADPQRDELLAVRRQAAETLEDVRRLARQLRPEALDQLGLVAALNGLCTRFSESSGLPVACELDREIPPVGPDAELVVYRVAQESLTNVARHAGASRVWVTLRAPEGERGVVELEVADDGRGLPDGGAPAGEGTGIRSMRERALVAGAELELGSRPPGGTRVRLRVPAEAQGRA